MTGVFHKFYICFCIFHMNIIDVTVYNLQLLLLSKIISYSVKGTIKYIFWKFHHCIL